jgi:hypothetical protein
MSDEYAIHLNGAPEIAGLASRLEQHGLTLVSMGEGECALAQQGASVESSRRWGHAVELRVRDGVMALVINGLSPRLVVRLVMDELCRQGVIARLEES